MTIQKIARKVVKNLKASVEAPTAIVVIDNVARDNAQRIIGATATIDGMQGQPVAIDYGAPLSEGDTYVAMNEGSPTAPAWILTRRIQSLFSVTGDERAAFPAPTGLDLEAGSWTLENGVVMPWIYVTWLTIDEEFVGVDYEAEVRRLEADPRTFLQFVPDDAVESTLRVDISDSDTVIPHAPSQQQGTKSANHFPTTGRIKIGSELIKYDVCTDAKQVLSGTGGVGGVNTFTVSGATWTTDEWINFCLIDSADDEFLISSNTSTVLTVVGTPASGDWAIYPAFSSCTRAQGGTNAAAHTDGDGIYRRSMGTMLELLSGGETYSIRVRAIRDTSKGVWSTWVSTQTVKVHSKELNTDPSVPAEGEWIIWMSDGTDSGDDGDIMLQIQAGGTPKTITLVDFSAGGPPGGGPTYGVPALTLGTTNAAGSTDESIRRDATIALFDATTPEDVDLSAAVGTAGVAARRDHEHALDVAIAPTWTGLHTFRAAGPTIELSTTSGDPSILFDIGGVDKWAFGVDDSASGDPVKLHPGSSLPDEARFTFYDGGMMLQRSAGNPYILLHCYSTTDTHKANLELRKSASATLGTEAETADDENLGSIMVYGSDTSSTWGLAAEIDFVQDGASGANYVPSRIEFLTSDGTATPAIRLTIDKDGNITQALNKYIATDQVRAIDSGGLKLYEDGGTTGLFIQDSGFVGIGTTNPSGPLEVHRDSSFLTRFARYSDNSGCTYLHLSKARGSEGSESNVQDGDYLGEYSWQGYYSYWVQGATIRAVVDGTPGTDDVPTELLFCTKTAGVAGVLPRMYIRSSGRISIGTADPSAQLDVEQPSATGAIPVLYLDQGDDDEEFIRFQGNVQSDASANISTMNGDGAVDGPKNYGTSNGWTFYRMVRCNVQGADAWIATYLEDTS